MIRLKTKRELRRYDHKQKDTHIEHRHSGNNTPTSIPKAKKLQNYLGVGLESEKIFILFNLHKRKLPNRDPDHEFTTINEINVDA